MTILRFTYFLTYAVGIIFPLFTAAAGTIRIGKTILDLPAGYTVHFNEGMIDSAVGNISVEGKPYSIHFDSFDWKSGPKNPSEFGKEILEGIIYYEAIQGTDPPTCIYAWLHPRISHQVFVTLRTLGAGASFDMNLPENNNFQDVYSVLRAIKITKRGSPPHP